MSRASADQPKRIARVFAAACALGLAIALSAVFWWPLWSGGAIVGSDIYAYFLPQKAVYAESLRAGEIPLWNSLGGHGYPLLAESQTGVFYPPNLLLYSLLPVDRAYHTAILLHYILAFYTAWGLARVLGIQSCAALLGATVYVYGWFPSRICLEWAIVGGAWLPLAIHAANNWVKLRQYRWLAILALVLAVQMLAGHFVIAFVTQLTCLLWCLLAMWIGSRQPSEPLDTTRRSLSGAVIGVVAALVCGFALAAVQLLPTWELKQHSQRQTVSAEHDPNYGYMPALYASQVVAPWYWYADEARFNSLKTPGGSRTNWVEAHLYFGLLPLALAIVGFAVGGFQRDRRVYAWLLVSILPAVYATGVLAPLTRHLPGFSYFEGPGRFGIVTTLFIGLLAGHGLEGILARVGMRRAAFNIALTAVVIAITATDLFWVSRHVTYAVLIPTSPLARAADSPLRRTLAGTLPPARLFSPARNMPALLGVAGSPPYLGLGPAAYFDDRRMPGASPFDQGPTVAQLDWLREGGITHLLSFEPLVRDRWAIDGKSEIRLIGRLVDPVLNPLLARGAQPLWLYELVGSRGRAAWETNPNSRAGIKFSRYDNQVITLQVETEQADRLILTDLDWPGWNVTIDGRPAPSEVANRTYRAVSVPRGKHQIEWRYAPRSFVAGAAVSLAALLMGAVVLFLYRRRF